MTDQLTCLNRIQSLIRQLPIEHELTVNASLPYITKCYEEMSAQNHATKSVLIEDILKNLNGLSQSFPQTESKKWVCRDVPSFSVELVKFLQEANIPVEVWEYQDGEYDYVTVRTVGVILHLYRA